MAAGEIDLRILPRERLTKFGPAQLSDRELVAILLGSGNKKHGVFALADIVLRSVDERNGSLSFDHLNSIPGIGSAKATLILAALEFARRRIKPAGTKIRDAADAYALVRHYAGKRQEHFLCMTLNGAHELIHTRVVTIGLLNKTQVHPREVFADALVDRAAAIIVAHNHPSGELEPSTADIEVTRQLVNAGKILGVAVLDHIVFGESGFVSLAERGVV